MKNLWMKVGTVVLAMVMMAGSMCIPAMAATEDEIKAAKTQMSVLNSVLGGFEEGVSEVDGVLKITDSRWNMQELKNYWVSDNASKNKTISIAESKDYTTIGIKGQYALKMRNAGGALNGWTARYQMWQQIPGALYKITARVYMHRPQGDTTEMRALLGASANADPNNFYTLSAMNPETYCLTCNEWVTITKYFVPSAVNFDIHLGSDIKPNDAGADGRYILWDDVKIQMIDNVLFDEDITEIKGGNTYNAKVLLGNTNSTAAQYTIIQSIYKKTAGGNLLLKKVQVSAESVSAVETYRAGQFRKDISFDLTGYSAEDDYVVKVMVWKNGVADMEPAYIGEKD